MSVPTGVREQNPELPEDQLRAVAVWWEAYTSSIRNRRGNHPTTQREAEKARDEAFAAVLTLLRGEES